MDHPLWDWSMVPPADDPSFKPRRPRRLHGFRYIGIGESQRLCVPCHPYAFLGTEDLYSTIARSFGCLAACDVSIFWIWISFLVLVSMFVGCFFGWYWLDGGMLCSVENPK